MLAGVGPQPNVCAAVDLRDNTSMLPQVVVALVGIVLVASALRDAFETVVLPHRVARRWRFARIYYKCTWLPYRAFARRFADGPSREAVLSYYGPLSLLLL